MDLASVIFNTILGAVNLSRLLLQQQVIYSLRSSDKYKLLYLLMFNMYLIYSLKESLMGTIEN